MKLFVDDTRQVPIGWVLARTCEEALGHLATGEVTALSVDHDMGLDDTGKERMNGYEMLKIVYKGLVEGKFKYPPKQIEIHSANIAARDRLTAIANEIMDFTRSDEKEG